MKPMPVLFVGHGSPMNALEKNAFTETLKDLGRKLPKPQAILCVSAHWETQGTQILYSAEPQTIHDFFGFPERLFQLIYPAHGPLKLAHETQRAIPNATLSEKWGLDHGTWSVLIHMYPHADIPVYQLGMDIRATPKQHYEIGQKLRALREKGVLILGSGNIVHNLQQLRRNAQQDPLPWAESFDLKIKSALENRDIDAVINFETKFPQEAALSVPTPEHFFPLLYTLGASNEQDLISFPYEGYEMGAISMRSVLWESSISI